MSELTDLFKHWLEENEIIMLMDKNDQPVGALFPSRVDTNKLIVMKSVGMSYDFFIEVQGLGIYFSKYKKVLK